MSDELNYIDEGNGATSLVFLHYFGGSSRTWKAVIELLKDRFHCVAVDLPGFGSSSSEGKPSIKNTVVKLEAFIQKSALKNYSLVGHSMGGKMALALAARKPEGLQQLLLVAPSPPTPEPANAEKQRELLQAYGNRKSLEKVAMGLTAKPLSPIQLNRVVDDNLRIHQPAWEGWITGGSQEDISSEMKNIDVPVTIISGDSDPNFSTSFLQTEFSRWFPHPTFIELLSAGHLMPIESPAQLANTIYR